MAKLLFACVRAPGDADWLERRVRSVCADRSLVPDNLTPRPPLIHRLGGVVWGIVNPAPTVLRDGASVLLGKLFEPPDDWSTRRGRRPDGSYALVRVGTDDIECATDAVGSRTLWYYKDDGLFVAATSQRAIVKLLGSFEFDERVLPWLMSSGTLGPSHSWDRRIQRLPADAAVSLDIRRWTLSLDIAHHAFETAERSDAEHAAHLKQVLYDVFAGIRLEAPDWALALSGGYDSRSILVLLLATGHDPSSLQAVTWGLDGSTRDEDSDADVARRVAAHYGVPHEFHRTDLAAQQLETVLGRFIVAGEGRIDHLGGYMDGFALWNALFERGFGVVRGDQAFGSGKHRPWTSDHNVRLNVGMPLCEDFANLRGIARAMPRQVWPEHLLRGPGESFQTWHDRLYQDCRQPTVIAALADLKLPFVELASPLLSRRVCEAVRQLPEHLRSDKALLRRIVAEIGPPIPPARREATAPQARLLRQPAVVDHVAAVLTSGEARSLIPRDVLDGVTGQLAVDRDAQPRPSIAAGLRRMVPDAVKDVLRRGGAVPRVDPNVLAFRLYLACRMHALLKSDAAAAG